MGIIGAEGIKARYMEDMAKLLDFSDDELAVIYSLNIFREYKKGTVLLKEGQFSELGYVVVKGCLKSYYMINYEEKITAFFTENEIFTPACIVSKKPATHYLSCVEDCLVSVFSPQIEEVMLKKFPRFEKLCRISSEELLSKQQLEFDDFKITSPEQRYINLTKNRPDLIQRIPQYQIASYLGLTPQSVSRIRRRLLTA